MTRAVAPDPAPVHVGIDLGGTKIAGIAMTPDGRTLAERRIPAPRDDYHRTIEALCSLVEALDAQTGERGTVGLGMPGSIAPASGVVQNSNSVWLNGRPLHRDFERKLGRPIRAANDANCFALSEAVDGAAAGARSVFGIIIGTGCGGGLVFDGRLIDGPNGISGEWGHNPLPWANASEHPGAACFCGRHSCLETWVSGTGLEADHARATGERLSADQIEQAALRGDAQAQATLERHISRLGRAIAHVVNIVDPHVIVLGGGLSNMRHLYDRLPAHVAPFVLAEKPFVDIRAPKHGDASGTRGAARLWAS